MQSRAKDRSAGDENVRAGFNRSARCLGLDAAVDFEVEFAAVRIPPFFGATNFVHHLRPKRLAAKTGMNRHDEKQVDAFKIRRDGFERRRGIQRQSDSASSGANRGERLRHFVS